MSQNTQSQFYKQSIHTNLVPINCCLLYMSKQVTHGKSRDLPELPPTDVNGKAEVVREDETGAREREEMEGCCTTEEVATRCSAK